MKRPPMALEARIAWCGLTPKRQSGRSGRRLPYSPETGAHLFRAWKHD